MTPLRSWETSRRQSSKYIVLRDLVRLLGSADALSSLLLFPFSRPYKDKYLPPHSMNLQKLPGRTFPLRVFVFNLGGPDGRTCDMLSGPVESPNKSFSDFRNRLVTRIFKLWPIVFFDRYKNKKKIHLGVRSGGVGIMNVNLRMFLLMREKKIVAPLHISSQIWSSRRLESI